MKRPYTHISMILDRTGSMEAIRNDTIGGFNAFLKKQKSLPGKATLTLVQFDTQDPYEVVHSFAPIRAVPELTRETYVPRAGTPLLDAIGRGINDLEACIDAMEPGKRPTRVVMVIITDGQENSSREFTKTQVEKMIKEKQCCKKWQFVFLGADLSAIDEAVNLGIRVTAVRPFAPTPAGVQTAFAEISACIADYREGETDEATFSGGKKP